MSDILDRLREWVERPLLPPLLDDLKVAIDEIEFLRLHAGAVTRGESHADLKRRVGPQAVESEP